MALTPADFYAYSRATGAQIPEDPEERAQMAPEVLEFRRNQLKGQPEGPNLLATLGTAAAVTAGALGLGLAGRRLLRGPQKSATAPVQVTDIASVRRAAAPIEAPAPSKPAPVAQPEVDMTPTPAATPKQRMVRRHGRMVPADSISRTPRFSPRQYAEQAGSLEPTDLTSVQEATEPLQRNQFINAVESGEDQQTGRLVKQINLDDPWGESTIPPSAVNEQKAVPLLPAAASSLREKAQSFLQNRFEQLGVLVPGRYRRERIMGQDPAIAEAVELYASTGDPSVLSRLSETPSSPLTVVPRIQTEVKEKEEIPTKLFYKPTDQEEFVDDLFEKDIKLTNKISAIGQAKQDILKRLDEIDQLEPQLRFAAADEPDEGGYYTRLLNKLQFEKQNLNPDALDVDLGDALAERDFVRSQMESAKNLGSQFQLVNRQEGVRPFFEVDPGTNEPIAETLEIRTGRPSVQLDESKTGGGRGYAMYDPDSQTGSSIGIYGIEPRNYPIADVELRPTALQREETKVTLRRGEYPKFNAAVSSTPEQKQRSLQVSEALRRANIEGRDPNMVLRQLGFNV